jgi:hypothetical protein
MEMILQRADKRCPVSGCSNVWDRFTSVYDKLYDERVQDFLRRQVSLNLMILCVVYWCISDKKCSYFMPRRTGD